ncbi:MAG: hypothetical protein IPK80_07870 [Nannocystis sp.]|nr:hypothetical protein [Nannocystis sp.]
MLVILAGLLASCNGVWTTEQCLGNGGTTSTFQNYTFEIESGPALDVAGNCHVVLIDCTIRAPMGIRAREDAVVTMRGGSLTATSGPAVSAAGRARVSFTGTQVSGEIQIADAARVDGLGTPR